MDDKALATTSPSEMRAAGWVSQADHDAAIAAAYEAAAQCIEPFVENYKDGPTSVWRQTYRELKDYLVRIRSLATQPQRDALAEVKAQAWDGGYWSAVARVADALQSDEVSSLTSHSGKWDALKAAVKQREAQAVSDALDQLPHTFIGASGGHFPCAVPYDSEHDQFTCLKCQAIAKVKEEVR